MLPLEHIFCVYKHFFVLIASIPVNPYPFALSDILPQSVIIAPPVIFAHCVIFVDSVIFAYYDLLLPR